MFEALEQLEEFQLQVAQEAALLTNAQTDLCFAFEQIEVRGGLDRETAMTIVNAVPSMEHMPNEFTLMPTDTNLQVAVEGFWSGLADAISGIFGLIFKLIFGVLDFLLKPVYWILGVDDSGKKSTNGGGLDKAVATAERIEEAAKDVKEVSPEEIKAALTDEVLKGSAIFNKLKYLASKNATAHSFKSLNLVTTQLNHFLVKANDEFITQFGKVDADNFDGRAKELEVITGRAAGKVIKEVNALVSEVNKIWDLKVPSAASSDAITEVLKKVEEGLASLNDEEVDVKILYREYSKFGTSKQLQAEVKRINEQLGFRNADEELVESIQKDRNKFQKQEKEVDKLSGKSLEQKELNAAQASELRTLINNHLALVRLATSVSRVATSVSIKGKRGVFDAINSVESNVKKIFAQVKKDEE